VLVNTEVHFYDSHPVHDLTCASHPEISGTEMVEARTIWSSIHWILHNQSHHRTPRSAYPHNEPHPDWRGMGTSWTQPWRHSARTHNAPHHEGAREPSRHPSSFL